MKKFVLILIAHSAYLLPAAPASAYLQVPSPDGKNSPRVHPDPSPKSETSAAAISIIVDPPQHSAAEEIDLKQKMTQNLVGASIHDADAMRRRTFTKHAIAERRREFEERKKREILENRRRARREQEERDKNIICECYCVIL